ncbi:porin family protein [Flavobacterium sp.]|uniref:porin family protein n=1 Tax=Flavobacterium sp. TaxID=239 RepID=UPI0039E47095
MKKVFLTALAVFAFGLTYAQKSKPSIKDVSFGLKGGLNVSTLSGDIDNADPKIGAHFGGLVEIKLTNRFAIQPEILLSLQGAKSEYSESGPDYVYREESKLHLTYLNFPVMAKFYVIPNLALEAGPQLGILVGAKDDFSVYENDNGQVFALERKQNVKGSYKTAEAAFNFGAAYYFNKNIFLEGRFSVGLSGINDGDYYYYVDGPGPGNSVRYRSKVTNNVFQLSFGYRF